MVIRSEAQSQALSVCLSVRRAAGRARPLRLDASGITGYTQIMKTAISIPDDLFHEVERCTRRLRVSRSRLFADAAREYLAKRRDPSDATTSWNQVIAEAGQPGDEPAAVAVRGRSKAVLRETMAKRR